MQGPSPFFNGGNNRSSEQDLAVHSGIRVTKQIYAHVQAEALRRAMGVLARIALDADGGTIKDRSQITPS